MTYTGSNLDEPTQQFAGLLRDPPALSALPFWGKH